MQQPKLIEQFQQRDAADDTSIVQRILGWAVQVASPPSSNAEHFDRVPLDLDQRVRMSGEW